MTAVLGPGAGVTVPLIMTWAVPLYVGLPAWTVIEGLWAKAGPAYDPIATSIRPRTAALRRAP